MPVPRISLSPASQQVRRLICQVLAKLYAAGDQLPLYSRVSSLQLFLGTREAFRWVGAARAAGTAGAADTKGASRASWAA